MNGSLHRKVGAGGLGGGLGIIVIWVLGFWVEVPPEVAAAISTVMGFVAGYFTSGQPVVATSDEDNTS